MEPRLIVFDADRNSAELLRSDLTSAGFDAVQVEGDAQRAAALLESRPPFDLAVIYMGRPGMGTEELLDAIRQSSPATESILICSGEDMPAAVQCLRKGAYGCLAEPFAPEQLVWMVRRALERKLLLSVLEAPVAAALRAHGFQGNERELQEIVRKAAEGAREKGISAESLPEELRPSGPVAAGGLPHESPALTLAEVEKRHILSVYRQLNRNKVRTARALEVGLNTVRRKLKEYGVS